MVRSILAVIVSYITMFILAFAALTCAYLVLGADQSFRPHSFQASKRWILMSLVVNIVIGIIGGFLCALIAKGGKAHLALAIVVFVLGLLLAIPSIMARNVNPEEVRRGNVPMFEAMQKAKEPVWVPLTFPFVGAIGVLVGGKLKRRGA